MQAFDSAFSILVDPEHEGGYSNNPADPGNWTSGHVGQGVCIGTIWGLSAPVLVRHGVEASAEAVLRVPKDAARVIAKAEYWDVYHCDDMPAQIGFQVLDAAYNGGHPAQWLQRAVGVAEDGVIGPVTLAAVKAADPDDVCLRFDAYRLQYMTELKTWPTFGRGWARRIAANLLRAAQ